MIVLHIRNTKTEERRGKSASVFTMTEYLNVLGLTQTNPGLFFVFLFFFNVVALVPSLYGLFFCF